ncbi:MAG: hypothetical protein Q7T82_21680 [Armatimonadota bacterium]|nr:hypothetical protein [Armatimonadota bacterium]
MKKTKKFDCVEMMHRGAERVRRETAGMTIEEEVEYWRRKTEELRERQRQAREAQESS